MGLFSHRRDDATTDYDESPLGRDLGSDDLDEAAASGPWDLSELPEVQEEVPASTWVRCCSRPSTGCSCAWSRRPTAPSPPWSWR